MVCQKMKANKKHGTADLQRMIAELGASGVSQITPNINCKTYQQAQNLNIIFNQDDYSVPQIYRIINFHWEI